MTKIAQQGQDITPIGKTSTENFEENEEEEVRSKIPNYSRLHCGPGLFRCYFGFFDAVSAFLV
jgi:hypothetical protein